MKFPKLPKTYEEQLALLKQRGLATPSDDEVIRWLRRVNYYRLSAYFIPFQEPRPSETFLAGSTWDRIIDLYIFDCRLRHLFKVAMERIEVSFRTAITYEMAHSFGTFAHTKSTTYATRFLFPRENRSHSDFDEFIRNVKKEEERASEVFVKAYRHKYTSEEFLPVWMATELMSFGTLSMMFKGLNQMTKARIASQYKMSFHPFQNWMHVLSSVRNITAHSSRLWNRELRVRPVIPHNCQYPIPPDRIYCVAVMIQHFLCMTAKGSQWKARLFQLLDTHKDVSLTAMGFPHDWRSLKPWAE